MGEVILIITIVMINFENVFHEQLQLNSSTPAELIMPKQTTPVHIHDKPIKPHDLHSYNQAHHCNIMSHAFNNTFHLSG